MRTYAIVRHAARALLLSADFVVGLQAQDIGPANGSLVIVGGATRDQAILERFLDLAGGGGADAPIVVIPTAGGGDEYDQYWRGLRQFKAAGATVAAEQLATMQYDL